MSKHEQTAPLDPEIAALSVVYDALRDLEGGSQQRVLDYVAGKLGLTQAGTSREPAAPTLTIDRPDSSGPSDDNDQTQGADDLEGISPVAIKWMRRNGLSAERLATVFSLGVEDIDLVAKIVPGKNKKDRMHSVLLLKGIASYLGTGAPRVSHQQVKEACLHYDAYDSTNFAAYLRSFASEVSGSKESGYTLSARGITVATDTLKRMLDVKA